ncbi:MAG TPA: thioredoxin [Pyrinomonadaceae bacterium]|nr:thioredoxin [Pyrinomonadaceae bacterium]
MEVVTCKNCGSRNRVDPEKARNLTPKCGKCGEQLRVATNGPVTITDATFQSDVLNAPGVVLLDCWAPWCGPCRMVGPIMEQLAAESNGRYRVAKLNVDDNPRTASQFQIQSIPTMLIFKDGQLIDRIIGAQPKQAIAQRLTNAL